MYGRSKADAYVTGKATTITSKTTYKVSNADLRKLVLDSLGLTEDERKLAAVSLFDNSDDDSPSEVVASVSITRVEERPGE